MDATRSSSALMLFKRFLVVHGLGFTPEPEPQGEGWEIVKCSSKKAYGCGPQGQQLAEGLTLYVRPVGHPADLTSFFSVGLSDEAAGIMEEKLESCRKSLNGEGEVKIAHQQALVIILLIRIRTRIACSYCLVYDATDASLSLIPYIPKVFKATYTVTPVPERSFGVIKLALMARCLLLPEADRDRLCIWTPAAQSNPEPCSTPWQLKVHRFVKLRLLFRADVSFTFEGKAFWADLSQGVAISDLRFSGDSAVDTMFIRLPDEYQMDHWADWRKMMDSDPLLPNNDIEASDAAYVSRTMGCFEDSIKFVCMDPRPAGNTVVKVLTLDLDQQLWKEDEGLSFPWDDLWKQIRLENAELKDLEETLVPQYPILMPDGALVFLLPNMPPGSRQEDYYVCRFDMRSKSPQCFGRVRDCDTPNPVILPFDFFSKSFPRPSHKKLPSTLLQKFEALSLRSGS